MAEYKNSIKIGIQLQTKNEVKQELQRMLDNISKETKLNLDLGKSLNVSTLVKEVNKLKDGLNLDGVTKSAFSSAKVFENELNNLADSIAKVREESNKKSNSDYLKSEKLQADAINKSLEEEYQQRLKLNNLKDTLQSKLNISGNNSLVDTSVITNLQNKLNSINTNIPEKEIKELQNAIKNLSSSDSQIVRLQNTISKMTANLSSIKGKFGSDFIDKNATNEVKNYEKELENLKKTLSDLQGGKSFSGAKISDNINKANSSVRDLNNILNETNKNTSSFRSSLKNAFANVGIYIGTYEAIRKTVDVIKDASQYVIQLDSALVGLKKVTNETDATYKAFLETAHNASLELGTQADKFTEATESWAKTGKSLAEATQLAKNTMLLTKVGDVDNVDTAQTYLLPALQAFNIEAEKSIDLVDKYNNLSNNMATDIPKMGEAMARGASSLSDAGNSLEETLSLIATASQNTQLSGETIGNGLKTISLRIAEFKDEDGEIIPKFEEQMKSLGVTMRDQDGQILSTYNILNQVAQKYGEMDRNTQLMVSQLLGGKFQSNVVSSILSDVNELNRAYNLANSSAGSATKEFETYQQSIQYSIDQLKENINHLYTEMVNSDALKSFVNGLSEAVQWLDSLDGQTIVFYGSVASLIVVLTKLSKINKEAMALDALKGSATTLKEIIAVCNKSGIVAGLSGAFGILTTSIKGATASALAFIATPVGAVITAIGVAIGGTTVAFNSYKKHQEEVEKQTESLKTSIQNLNDTLASGSTEGVENDLNNLQKQQDELQKYIRLLEDTKAKSEDTFNPTAGGASKESIVAGMTQKVAEYKKEIEDAGAHVNAFGEIVELTNAKCTKANLEMIESVKQQTAEQLNNRENLEQAQAEYDNYITTVKGLYNEYQNLSAQESLSADSKARLNTVVQELQGKFSNLSVTIDENGVAYINNIPLIQDSINNLESEGMTIDSLSNIRVADQKVNATWQINNTSVTYGEINKRIEIYKAEIKAIQTLMSARIAGGSTEAIQKENLEHASIGKMMAGEIKDRKQNADEWAEYDKKLANLREYENAKNEIDKLYNSIQAPTYSGGGGGSSTPKYSGLGGGSSSSGSGSKGSKSSGTDWVEKGESLVSNLDIDQYASLNSELEDYNNNLSELSNRRDGLSEGSKEYIEIQEKEIAIKEKQMSVYSELAGGYSQERNQIQENLKSYGILTDETGRLINAEEKLREEQTKANMMSTNTEAEYEAKKKAIEQIKDLQSEIKRFREITQKELPKATEEWDKLNNSIKETRLQNLQSLKDDLANGLKQKYSDEKDVELAKIDSDYEVEKAKIENTYNKKKEQLEKELQVEKDRYQDEIDNLKKQIEDLEDDTEDKKLKLEKLVSERNAWSGDDSSFSKKQQLDLDTEIAELRKEIQKAEIEKQIEDLENKQKNEESYYSDKLDSLKDSNDDELKALENSYKTEKAKAEQKYKDLLDDHNIYAEADKMILNNQIDDMLNILNLANEDFKKAGTLIGINYREGLITEVEKAISDLSRLTGGVLGGNISITTDTKLLNMATSSGDTENNIARFATGGRTPSNMSGGKLGILDPNEKILNSEETNTFDKGMEIINTDLKDFIDKFDSAYRTNTLNGYNNLDVFGSTTDLNSMVNRAMNNTTNNNSDSSTIINMKNNFNITNNKQVEANLMPNDIVKVINKQLESCSNHR